MQKITFSDTGEQQIPPQIHLWAPPERRLPAGARNPGCSPSPCPSPHFSDSFPIPARGSVAGVRPLALPALFAQARWGPARDSGATGRRLAEAPANLSFPRLLRRDSFWLAFFFLLFLAILAFPCFSGFSLRFWLFLAFIFLLFFAFF